jgi:hypothetical protein
MTAMDDAALRARVEAILEASAELEWGGDDIARPVFDAGSAAEALVALFAPILAERDALIDSYLTDPRPWSPGRPRPFVAFADGAREEEFADHAAAVAYVRDRLGLGPDPAAALSLDHPSTT